MINRFDLIFEMLAVFICLYGLYGVKFEWNIHIILCIAVELVLYQIAEVYQQFGYYKLLIGILLFLYTKIQFRCSWGKSVVNYTLCLVIEIIVQLACYLPIMLWQPIWSGHEGYIINILLFVLTLCLYKTNFLHKLATFMQQKEKMMIVLLILTIIFAVYVIYSLSVIKTLDTFDYFLILISVGVLLALLLQLQKAKLLNKQIRMEADLNKLYGDALKELIDNIRINQHNYKNQISAMRGMIFSANSLEELKKEQQEYYNRILHENRCVNILSGNNDPLIAGFLYSKFINIDSNHIEVEHSLKIDRIKDSFITSDVIKILGVLIDNAVEEVEKECYQHKGIEIKVYENKKIILEVGNVCNYVKSESVVEFFQKGSSSKGEDRGLGLYSVTEITNKWHGEIITENREKNGENWFYVIVELSTNKRL